jgi:hypothetical protein
MRRGVVVFSHPRSGTHLTLDFLRRNFSCLSPSKPFFAPLDALYVSLDAVLIEAGNHDAVKRAVAGLMQHRMPLMKTHWVDPDFTNLRNKSETLSEWVVERTAKVYVIRRPDRVISSLFNFEAAFSAMIYSKKGEWLAEKTAYWVRHVREWSAKSDVLILKFEDMIDDPRSAVATLSQHIGLGSAAADPLLPPRTKTLWRNRILRLSRRPASTEILSPQRPRPLSELFEPKDVAAFWREVTPVCEMLGYDVAQR